VTYLIVREPTDDEKLNMYILYKLSTYKDSIVGVYYIEELGYYGPILKLRDIPRELKDIVRPVDVNIVRRSLKMICMRCGWCCERESGAFMFENEAERVGLSRWSRIRTVKLINGDKVRVYYVDAGPNGRCIFYDPKRKLCTIHKAKPVICVVTYCARYAVDSEGNLYRRVSRSVRGVVHFKKVQTTY